MEYAGRSRPVRQTPDGVDNLRQAGSDSHVPRLYHPAERFRSHLCNPLIDGGVNCERFIVERRQIDAVMEDRPENAVRVLEVETFMFLMAEVGQNELDAVITEDVHTTWLFVNKFAAPAEPDAA